MSQKLLEKQQEAYQARRDFDQTFSHSGAVSVIGVDEVGRGSLIGDVYTAAVTFPESFWLQDEASLSMINDSKKLSPERRAQLCVLIETHAYTALGRASVEEIEQLNIHHATLLAMHRACESLLQTFPVLMTQPRQYLVDGCHRIPAFEVHEQTTVVKGDQRSLCIAAASIVAKHRRDEYVQQLAEEYAQYDWQNNAGYGTPAHRRAIATLGPTPHHRPRFLRGILGV